MEVLDNLPHDKIAWTTPSSGRGALPYPRSSSTTSSRSDASAGASGNGCVRQPQQGKGEKEKELCEAVVVPTSKGHRECFRPLQDSVIRELVLELCPDIAAIVKPTPSGSPVGRSNNGGSTHHKNAWKKYVSETFGGLFAIGADLQYSPRADIRAAFVPTGLLQLLHALRTKLPRHRAILADFDSFPLAVDNMSGEKAKGTMGVNGGVGAAGKLCAQEDGVSSLLAFQAPIVSSRDPATGVVTDHDTYMVPLGSADIFFPTCFKRLSRLHAAVCGGRPGGCGRSEVGIGIRGRRKAGVVMKQGRFIEEHGDVAATRTLTGYNPMVEDYSNASVFLSGAVVE